MFDTAVVDPDLLELSDVQISEFMSSAQEESFIGVRFPASIRTYTYIGLPGVQVGSKVLVPGNSFHPEPHTATVVSLNQTPPPGVAIKRILKVLS